MKTRLDANLLVVAQSDLYYNHIIMFFHQFSASLHMHKILKIDRSSLLIIAGLHINYDFILNFVSSPVQISGTALELSSSTRMPLDATMLASY